jgi:hypothetical protein
MMQTRDTVLRRLPLENEGTHLPAATFGLEGRCLLFLNFASSFLFQMHVLAATCEFNCTIPAIIPLLPTAVLYPRVVL